VGDSGGGGGDVQVVGSCGRWGCGGASGAVVGDEAVGAATGEGEKSQEQELAAFAEGGNGQKSHREENRSVA